jgi:hypothetical protein
MESCLPPLKKRDEISDVVIGRARMMNSVNE